MGRAFSTTLHQQYDLVYDPVILSYVRHIGNKITSETGQNRSFSFYIINNSEINAFAGPNGVIGIHTGLIEACQTEDELASVIAHEVAHVTQRHLSRTFEYQNNTASVSSIASLIAAILVGSQDINAGIATYMGGMGLNIEQQLKNSRIHESEADYFGIKYLEKAGYNPNAMADFFGRLSKEAQQYEFKVPEILQTHPVTENRLAKARARAYQLSDGNMGYHSKSLRLIQLRLRALMGDNKSYREQPLTDYEKCYLNNFKQLNRPSAHPNFDLACLDKAIKARPTDKLLRIERANINSQLAADKSLEEFTYLEAIYPSDFSIPYLHAKALARNNQREKAIELLKSATPKYHYQYLLYSELARLYSETNATKFVYYYDALANYNIGNIDKTLHLVHQAKKLEKNQKSVFYTKLQQLEDQITPDKKKPKDKENK
ncbi:MAG: M48 family metalloprotease [Hydrogenovibrio sp.]|nr:M48 family metalloprotease [Hydrogenovibrio sp.]